MKQVRATRGVGADVVAKRHGHGEALGGGVGQGVVVGASARSLKLAERPALQQLDGIVPARDQYEPNDDAGSSATRLFAQTRVDATLDFWDDQQDVYKVALRAGQRMYVGLTGPPRTDVNLMLWRPGTTHVDDLRRQHRRLTQSARPGPREWLAYRASRSGLYYLQVKMASAGAGRYRLRIVKT